MVFDVGERNYHIFYQLCASRAHPRIAPYQLEDASAYRFLNQVRVECNIAPRIIAASIHRFIILIATVRWTLYS